MNVHINGGLLDKADYIVNDYIVNGEHPMIKDALDRLEAAIVLVKE